MFKRRPMSSVASTLLVACGLLLCSCSRSHSQLGFKRNPSEVQVQAASTAMEGTWCTDYFIVRAMINERGPFRLLLDTGAAVSLLDDDAAAQLDVPLVRSTLLMTGSGGSGVRGSGQVRVARLVSGGLTLLNFDMVVHDLARFEPFLGPLDGVLGYSTLRGTTFSIDYPGRTVTVTNERLDPQAPRQPNEAWFKSSKLRPHVLMDVAGREVSVLADSGSGGGFDLAMFDELPRSGGDRPSHASLGLDRLIISRAARLDGDVQLGPIVFATPAIGTDPSGSKIGTQVMSEFRWTFDTRAGLLRVDGGPLRIEPEPVTNLGFVGAREASANVVVHVAEDSAAHANGLRKDDRVVAINGVPIESCACEGMRAAFERATPVVLSIERGEERLSIEAPAYTVLP